MNLRFLDQNIKAESEFKYLGVVFDKHLTWKSQADHICKKVAARIGILRRIGSCLTTKAALTVYNTIILSIFDYCDTTWSGILQQDQDRMQRLQKRAAKVIVKDPTIHSSEALK